MDCPLDIDSFVFFGLACMFLGFILGVMVIVVGILWGGREN